MPYLLRRPKQTFLQILHILTQNIYNVSAKLVYGDSFFFRKVARLMGDVKMAPWESVSVTVTIYVTGTSNPATHVLVTLPVPIVTCIIDHASEILCGTILPKHVKQQATHATYMYKEQHNDLI